jgi:hypothetical protein
MQLVRNYVGRKYAIKAGVIEILFQSLNPDANPRTQ